MNRCIWHRILLIGQEAATVECVRSMETVMPKGLPPPDLWGIVPDPRAKEKRFFDPIDCHGAACPRRNLSQLTSAGDSAERACAAFTAALRFGLEGLPPFSRGRIRGWPGHEKRSA